MGIRDVKKSTTLLLVLMLQGCASSVPVALRDAPESSPSLGQVRTQPETYTNMRLRWGGGIVRIENLPETTRLEIVARPLYKHGEPMPTESSEGRFIAQFDQFLDPSIYTVGREITVVGRFIRMQQRELDQMQYNYPLLRIDSHHLWPLPQPYQEPHYDPFLHDPFFYDPWYPFGYPYPYPYIPNRHWQHVH